MLPVLSEADALLLPSSPWEPRAVTRDPMRSLLELSNREIALVLVGGGTLCAITLCLGLCGMLHG